MGDDPCRPAATAAADTDVPTLPVISEDIHVGRHTVETARVRITRSLRTHEREVALPDAVRTAVEVERVPVGRPVERLEPPRVEGDVTIIPVYEEVAVVTRQWVLKEELRVRTVRRHEPQAAQRVSLQVHDVDVQREELRDAPPSGAPVSTQNKTCPPEPRSTGAPMNTTTIVAVFDDRTQAQTAARRLEEAGVSSSAIRIQNTSDDASSGERHEGGGIRSFFAELFGIGAGKGDDDDDYSGHYAEAVRRGSTVITVQAEGDAQVGMATDVLEDCGAIDIDERLEQWRGAGYEGYDETRQPTAAETMASERQPAAREDETGTRMPVVQEDLKIGKREVARGRVRVHRRVVETPVEEQVALREERAVVDRRAVDRPATPADMDALKDETIEFTESAEEPVVEKTARVVEEVQLGKRVEERKATVRDTVRRTEVEVENATASGGGSQQQSQSGVTLGGAAGASLDKPSGSRGAYQGPERRRSVESGYSGLERRGAAQ